MATRNHKRSSILKKRPSLASGSSNESSPTQTLPKISKKINFSVKNNVKEFTTQDERNTIWINSYEESAEGFSNAHSSEENVLHSFAHQRLISTTTDHHVITKLHSEHDKENAVLFQVPLFAAQTRHISSHYHNSVDMSLTMEDQELSRLKRVQNFSTHENTMHLLSDLNRFNEHAIKSLKLEEEDMDLTGEDVMVNAPCKVELVRSPRKTIFFHQPLNISISIEDSVQICDAKYAPPDSERVIFRSNPIANKFPASFTKRLKQFDEDDMSFGSYFAPEKPIAASPLDETNAMNVSILEDEVQKSPAKEHANRRTIHYEQHNEIEETLLAEAVDIRVNEMKPVMCNDMSCESPMNKMNISAIDIDLPKPTDKSHTNRRTIHFEQNNQLEETLLPEVDLKAEIDKPIISDKPHGQEKSKVRESVYLNENVDSVTSTYLLPQSKVGRTRDNRKTMILLEDIEKSTEYIVEPTPVTKQKRQTIYCNETIDDVSATIPVLEEVCQITNSIDEMNLSEVVTTVDTKNARGFDDRVDAETSVRNFHENYQNLQEQIPKCSYFQLNLSKQLQATPERNGKSKNRQTVYESIEMKSASSLAPVQERTDVCSPSKLLQPIRTILIDASIDTIIEPVNPSDSSSTMDVTNEAADHEQRLSARRTIMFGENTAKANIEMEDVSVLQPLPNMSVIDMEASNRSNISDNIISLVEGNIPTRKTTYFCGESLEQSCGTPGAVQEKDNEITIDVCRAVPYQDDKPTFDCDKTVTKITTQTATPSKIPVAKHRLTMSNVRRESPKVIQTHLPDSSEVLLENESNPCVEQLDEDQHTSNSTQSRNFERFRERYLNLTMPSFSDANRANDTLKALQSFGSMMNLMNYSTPSIECSAILEEIKEKVRMSNGTANVSVMDKGKVFIDWTAHKAKIDEIQKRRVPLGEMMVDMKAKIDALKLMTRCEVSEGHPQDEPEEEQTKYLGAIFPLAPSFTSLWKNLGECKKGNQFNSELSMAPIYPLDQSFSFLLKNKIVTEMKSWILDEMFFHSGVLELHNKWLKTIKLRLFFVKSEDTLPVKLQRARFMESHNVHLMRKSRRHKLLHLEFRHRHPFETPPAFATNELTDYLSNVQAEIGAIDQKVKRLFNICECFDVDIVEKPLQLLLQKEYNEQLCEVMLLDTGGNSNLAGLTRACIRLCPEAPEIMNKLVKYTGLELLEVLFYELDKSKDQ